MSESTLPVSGNQDRFTPFLVPRTAYGPVHEEIAGLLSGILGHDGTAEAEVSDVGSGISASIRRACALYRIDSLAGLMAASHGWLGATFSAMEILACIYSAFIPEPGKPLRERGGVFLSKGHAAMAQYAILAARGVMDESRLLTYKQIGGLPAHCGSDVPGVDSDSGSLGMGLSKALGWTLSGRLSRQGAKSAPATVGFTTVEGPKSVDSAAGRFPAFAILGDGELQEGQVFESLLTLASMGSANCVPIVDRNRLQTDSRTCDIKDAREWRRVFEGIGLDVHEVDGHDPGAVISAIFRILWGQKPGIVIADTFKGHGTTVTSMGHDTGFGRGVWHGAVPTAEAYALMLKELSQSSGIPEVITAANEYLHRMKAPFPGAARGPATMSVSISPASAQFMVRKPGPPATGDGFGKALSEMGNVAVLDADLRKSCRLEDFAQARPGSFFEVGISEQDMVSMAAGFAIGGILPVVNTYAAFHRRALDQVFAAAVEGLPMIVAGHYGGLDYHSDGKSHQSLWDTALMSVLPGVEVYEPVTPEGAGLLLEWLSRDLEGRPRVAYLRLHRSGPEGWGWTGPPSGRSIMELQPWTSPVLAAPRPVMMLASGPHMTQLALEVEDELSQRVEVDLISPVCLRGPGFESLVTAVQGRAVVAIFEDSAPGGPLAAGVREMIVSLAEKGFSCPAVRCFCPSGPGPCSRSLGETMEWHGLVPGEIAAGIEMAMDGRNSD